MNERPNILLVMTDQQRGDCVAADPVAPAPLQTPNLDALARSGAHFLHAYAESPSCIPARRSLMSGTAPAANGAVGFRGGVEWNPPATLAGELSRAGYQTEMIGKLHLHPDRRRYGFDHMQLANSTRGGDNEYVQWLREMHGRREVDPGMAHGVSSNGLGWDAPITCPRSRCTPSGSWTGPWSSSSAATRAAPSSSTSPSSIPTRP